MGHRRHRADVPPTIRAYHPADESAVLRVWNAALARDPISPARWRTEVLLDPNFRPEGCLVAEVQDEVRGFVLALTRHVPFYGDGLQPEQAWISAFGVEPGWQGRGLGSALLAASLARLRQLGCRAVTVGPYLPHFFMPGVDLAAYATAVAFLQQRGFRVAWEPIDLHADVTSLQTPPSVGERAIRLAAEGVAIRPVEPGDIVPVLAFIREHFDWSWYRAAEVVLGEVMGGTGRAVGMQVAVRGEAVLGYVAHEGEQFGPLGVHPDWRRRGIGTILTGATLQAMRQQGRAAVSIRYTYEAIAAWYANFGFQEIRRYALLERALE